MRVPESTSSEAFERYIGGQCLKACSGEAWRDIKAWITAPPRTVDSLLLPAVSEPFLAWTRSGEVEFQEREGKGPWIKHRIRKGSFFLTSGGAPYECRWNALTPESFETMTVFIELPLLQRAMEEVFGTDAPKARLKDVSAFTDAALDSLVTQVHGELMRKQASPLLVQGLGQAIAVHLARNYAELADEAHRASPSLPGFKVRQITEWMTEHVSEDINLEQLADRVGLSKFHFHRLFKSAAGVSPSRYHLNLRMNLARRLLRESKTSIVVISLEVGYHNPSHFAQLFKRETGLSPSDYRRQR